MHLHSHHLLQPVIVDGIVNTDACRRQGHTDVTATANSSLNTFSCSDVVCCVLQAPELLLSLHHRSTVHCPRVLVPRTAQSPILTSQVATSSRSSCARCCAWLPTACMTCAVGWILKTPTARRLRHRCGMLLATALITCYSLIAR